MPILTMVNQVIILFVLMGLGFALARFRVFDEHVSQKLTWLLCYIVMPCLILYSFQAPFSQARLHNFLEMFVITAGLHLLCIVLARLFLNGRTLRHTGRLAEMRAACVYPNCGFMGIPLISALQGSTGVFYGSVFITVNGIFAWSHGLMLFSGQFDRTALKKSLTNPNILAAVVGLPMFLTGWHLPDALQQSLHYVANLNTALSMMIIGAAMSRIRFAGILSTQAGWLCLLLRNLLFPLICLLVMWWLGIEAELLLCALVLMACPVAGITVIFAQLTGRDTQFTGQTLTLSTLLSVLTLPLMLALAQWLLTQG